ncbi:MAG: hypothetical protein HQL16_07825 [Candidatus Omnitrophica bacterium]|nr:hypothetical protein [Candidatus Omnitrophota bacterium]
MDNHSYEVWLASKERDAESLCRHCGACCGAKEDPCEHLVFLSDGKSSCRVYPNRLGPQRTVSGKAMTCIPIRQKRGVSWPGDESCGYKI